MAHRSVHKGKKVQAWLAEHPRFRMHFTPVHGSWMNQVEPWFSLSQRKRLVAPNFADLDALEKQAPRLHLRVESVREKLHGLSVLALIDHGEHAQSVHNRGALHRGAPCDRIVASAIRLGSSSGTFRDVERNGECGAAELFGERGMSLR